MNVFIVIAAYNEGRAISKVIKSLQNSGYHNIVVVDDGSKDNTSQVALDSGAVVLKHVVNRGQGAALKTGMEYALRNGADIIVHFDADGQHRVEDLKAMISPVASGKYDITVGSRFLTKAKIPFMRKLTLKTAVLVVWLFYGVKMTDAHNGFRAMNRKAAQKINITSDRMEHASQIVEEMYKKNLRYKEVPVIILYTDYSLNHGHGGIKQALKVFMNMIRRKIFN
ncbi:MAG TPA: glycosyltransferase family 2 protein [Alphaproteobacteria bacterium]|nr:glycosyltransferase family 2 protein [Alphaproteobacteria bacterium]